IASAVISRVRVSAMIRISRRTLPTGEFRNHARAGGDRDSAETMGSPDAIARRRAIARRAAQPYASNPAVAAVLLAGSVARGLAAAFSDIEVDVYWRRPPTDAERIAAVEGAGWDRVYAEADEHEWADGLRIDGVKLDISGFLTSTIDDYLDAALARADTE